MSYLPKPWAVSHWRAALLFAMTQSAKRHAIAWLMLLIFRLSANTPMSRTDAMVTEFA